MPSTDCQGSSASFNHIGPSILSLRRERIYSMDAGSVELEAFQKKVAERFEGLSSAENDDLLSIAWVRKLLDVFLCCQEEFRVILFKNSSIFGKSQADRLMAEFFERSVKALDVCNAIREGIERIRRWQKNMEIVLCALDSNKRTLGEGQFRRAKKALIDLAIALLDEKDSGTALAHRNRSFGRNNGSPKEHHRRIGHFRSSSWSVSRSWSAARQLQALGNNLTAPRTNEISATSGLAVPFFTISSVLLFVMWALVAAIPCQDRGLHIHFSIPRQFMWAAPILSLHDRILESSKKRERRNACGLLKEVHMIDRYARLMNELVDSVQFPLTEKKEREIRQRVQDLGMVYEAVKEGLDPLERQVKEVFHRIVRSRTERLDSFGRTYHND